MTALFWILLYVIGFTATTIGMKLFEFGQRGTKRNPNNEDWWLAVFCWPLFVPISLCVMFITRIACASGSWWDKASDELVEKIKNRKLS